MSSTNSRTSRFIRNWRRRRAVHERPVLFNGPMIRAILEGRKTQTRRLIKPQPVYCPEERIGGLTIEAALMWDRSKPPTPGHGTNLFLGAPFIECPFGRPGDRLWCREAIERGKEHPGFGHSIKYSATMTAVPVHEGCPAGYCGRALWRWQKARLAAMSMPRWASRLILEIESVRVERLQAITEEDAMAQGVPPVFDAYPSIGRDQRLTTGEPATDSPYRSSFAISWDETHGKRAAWKDNPWVWVINFCRLGGNRDEHQ